MRALLKLFSQFRQSTTIFFFVILPEASKFTVLVLFLLWSSYKREKSKYKYRAEINKKSSKFVFRIRNFDAPAPELLLCCSICLSEYEDGEEGRDLQCKHRFHRSCLEKWLQESRGATCPICRFLVLPKKTAEEYKREMNVDSGYEEEIALLLLSATRSWNCNGF